MNRYTDKAKNSLDKVIQAFRDGTIAEKCAIATYPMPHIPAAAWSLNNRWIAFMQTGEVDCRGFRQWKEAGRKVKKGERAGYILRPMMVNRKAGEDANKGLGSDSPQDGKVCVGFAPVAVFASHQTEGAALEYENITLPDLPLLNVAKAWGIDVAAIPFAGSFYGRFSRKADNSEQRIALCSPDAKVFYHEIAHAGHLRVRGALKGGQDAIQEIVAELSSEVLRRLSGSDTDTSGNTYEYIQHYAATQDMDPLDACLKVLNETAKVVALILETADNTNQAAA